MEKVCCVCHGKKCQIFMSDRAQCTDVQFLSHLSMLECNLGIGGAISPSVCAFITSW